MGDALPVSRNGSVTLRANSGRYFEFFRKAGPGGNSCANDLVGCEIQNRALCKLGRKIQAGLGCKPESDFHLNVDNYPGEGPTTE